MSILVSIVEAVSISAIMVFISAATNFDSIEHGRYTGYVYQFFAFRRPADFIIVLGLCLIVFYLLRAVLNIIHIYFMSKFSHFRQHYFSKSLFANYLNFLYKDFALKNSSKLTEVIFSYTTNTTQVIFAFLTIFSEMFTVFCVYLMLVVVNWKMTIVLSFLLVTKVYIIVRLFSQRITDAGKSKQKYSLKRSKIFSESFGNYKFLKLIARNQLIRERFEVTSLGLARANTAHAVWQGLPRFILETIGFFILIAIVLYVIIMHNNAGFVVPIVSMYALAFYRLLPSMNKIVMSYNQLMFNKHALKPVYDFLQQKFEYLGDQEISFCNQIELHNLSFGYTEPSEVFHDVTLTVRKGQRIGFVGESGAGKSTLVDLIMGLYVPESGSIQIDGMQLNSTNVKSWRKKIGYIPQSVYLFHGTVADNVACGREFDKDGVVHALKKAHIYDFLEKKNGIESRIGEGGINLSGGQKQRIAIARALYSDPEILVLDEATSALDNETEAKIMNEIYQISKDKTLLVIAHRVTTIKRCDKIYKVEGKRVWDVSHEYVDVGLIGLKRGQREVKVFY